MIWRRLRGHRAQVEMFRRAAERGRLGQGYLFFGPAGVGKRLFARLLAQCLFCERTEIAELDACGECGECRRMEAGVHPDFLSIGLPEGKRELPVSLLIGDRDHRGQAGLCHDLSLSPMSAKRRVAVIDDAEAMNEESSNALLKTLEEPPPFATLILIATDLNLLLPTIRSRCQPVAFRPLPIEDLQALLPPEVQTQPMERLLDLSGGSLEVAQQLLQPEVQQLADVVEQQLGGGVDARRASAAISQALEAFGSDPASQRAAFRWALQLCVETLRRQLCIAESPARVDRLAAMLERCFDAEQHLQQTMPVPLCLDALCGELARRSRTTTFSL